MATNAFNVGAISIRHTGSFGDRVESDEKGAHLFIDAEFEVKEKGNYHVQGSLYSEDGEPIGWAQRRASLDKGTHVVPLKFYGTIFCEKAFNGPYILRNFIYANVEQMPGPRSGNLVNLHTTAPYKYSDFTCEAFNDEALLKKAEALEIEASNEE